MLSWSHINDTEDGGPRETDEAREARHNAAYKEALFLHGEGSPHSDEWARARHLYETVLSDDCPSSGEEIPASVFKATPVRFLCLKNLADMFEKEGNDGKALELHVAAAEEDETDLTVWLKMARVARRAGLLNLARLALERLLGIRGDHMVALRTLKEVLLEIGDFGGVRQVSARLLNLDVKVASCSSSSAHLVSKSRWISKTGRDSSTVEDRTLHPVAQGADMMHDPQVSAPPPIIAVERSLEIPSWERVGSLLLDLKDFICGDGTDVSAESGGKYACGDNGDSAFSPCPTLSTPVRIVLPKDIDPGPNGQDESTFPAVNLHSTSESAAGVVLGVGVEGGERPSSCRHRQQQRDPPRRRRRPSVERAIEEYNDGASSDSDREGEDKAGGGAQCGGDGVMSGRKGKGKGVRNLTRRTSARRQRQDEMREANVAAERENDMQFRVANLFFPGDDPTKCNSESEQNILLYPPEETNDEKRSWWLDLERADGGNRAGSCGTTTSGARVTEEEEEATLVAKVLPMWKKRHDEECRRCGGEGMLVCCDFCHLVFHPRCLEVTPTVESLFACSHCKEEAATLAWELRGRDAASIFLEGGMPGLKRLLRAAEVTGGRAGNAGVVDLMFRWLQGVANAPPEELCAEQRDLDGLNAASDLSQLANLALGMEPMIRSYVPARASWPPTVSDSTHASIDLFPPSTTSTTGIGPELDLACELILVEMHLDKALASTVRRRGGCKEAASGSSPPTAAASSLAPTAPTTTAPATTTRAGEGAVDGTSGSEKAAAVKPNLDTTENDCFSRVALHLESAMAARHLAAADRAILRLEPFFPATLSNESQQGESRQMYSGAAQVDAGRSLGLDSEDMPWTFSLRWWWLCGLRGRHAGERERALDCFQRCERMLKSRNRSLRRDENDGIEGESGEGAVVVLPYCAAHPRIDLQVVRGVLADMELSGTSETAREMFEDAIRLLSAPQPSKQAPSVPDNPKSDRQDGGTRSESASPPSSNVSATSSRGTGAKNAGALGTKAGATRESGKEQISLEENGSRGGSSSLSREVVQSNPLSCATPEKGTGVTTQDPSTPDAPNTSRPGGSARSVTLVAAATQSASRQPSPSMPGVAQTDGSARDNSAGEDEGDLNGAGSVSNGGISEAVPKLSSEVSTKRKACDTLTSLLRSLESRFLERTRGEPVGMTSTMAANTHHGVSDNAETPGAAGEGALKAFKNPARAAVGMGWTHRCSSAAAEELLADLLEREKSFFSQAYKEGVHAQELWADSASSTPFAAQVTQAPAALPPPTAGPAVVPTDATATSSTGGLKFVAEKVAGAGGAFTPDGGRNGENSWNAKEGAANNVGKSTAAGDTRYPQRHLPLLVSGPDFGDNTSVFAMIVRSALILGRYETAILIAVRCMGHFLDVADLLNSPRGPLSSRGRRAVHARVMGNQQGGGGRGGRGIGAVSLLLTVQDPGVERRVDTETTSACCIFLAHALAVVVWAIPHDERDALLGGRGAAKGVKWAKEGIAPAQASGRRATVLRCLARLMRHSMDTNDIRLLRLSVRAWQALIAVAPQILQAFKPSRAGDNSPQAGSGETPDAGPELPEDVEFRGDKGKTSTNAEQTQDAAAMSGEVEGGSDSPTASDGPHYDGRRVSEADAFSNPERALVRSLCGVITGRWDHASSLGSSKIPKKSWVLHAMEAVHALAQTLQSQRTAGSNKYHNPPSGRDAAIDADKYDGDGSGNGHGMGISERFFSCNELREVVHALMRLSRLPDGLVNASVALAVFPRGWKLACALAVAAIGLNSDASCMDVPRKVKLLEVLHEHLKGVAAGSSEVQPGQAAQPGKAGVCAEGDGIFLKTVLLYLASQEVHSAVEEDRTRRGSAARAASHLDESASSCSGSFSTEDTEEEDESDAEDALQSEEGEGGYRNGNCSASMTIDGESGQSKRRSRLGERVVRVLAQCQACLYDVAVVPCEDHRCYSTPKPPSTVAEAHALYVSWESRLPHMRRPRALRLLEAVIANEAFASPPVTRFSPVVEDYLFSSWEEVEDMDNGADGVRDDPAKELEDLLAFVEIESKAHDQVEPHEVDRDDRRDAAGAGDCRDSPGTGPGTDPGTDGEHYVLGDTSVGDNTSGARDKTSVLVADVSASRDAYMDREVDGMGALEDVVEDERPQASRSGAHIKNTRRTATSSRGSEGLSSMNLASTASIGRGSDSRQPSSEKNAPDGPKSAARRVLSRNLGLPREKEAYSSVYTGLYRYLAEAKGVPFGFKSRMTRQPADEVMADMEASLMQAIRVRVLDLRFSPGRRLSWKGLAQCAARLAAIYLDAFPPTCHQLGLPLTTFGDATAAEAKEVEVGEDNPTLEEARASQIQEQSRVVRRDENPVADVASPRLMSSMTAGTVSDETEDDPRAPASSPSCAVASTGENNVTDAEKVNGSKAESDGGSDDKESSIQRSDTHIENTGTPLVTPADAAQPAPEPTEAGHVHHKGRWAETANTGANEHDVPPRKTSPVDDAGTAPIVLGRVCPISLASSGQNPETTHSPDMDEAGRKTSPESTERLYAIGTKRVREDHAAFEDPSETSPVGTTTDSSAAAQGTMEPTSRLSATPAVVLQSLGDSYSSKNPTLDPANPPDTRPAHQNMERGSRIPDAPGPVLGLRAMPGPNLRSFFSGTALDSASARGVATGGGAVGKTSVASSGDGNRVAAIAEGLRRFVAAGKARTAGEVAALEGLATRVADGTASQEEWNACLRHASITCAVHLAQKSFAVWRKLAEAGLIHSSKREESARACSASDGKHTRGFRRAMEWTKELQECYEEEAFMTYMVARDVWTSEDDGSSCAGSAGGTGGTSAGNPTPVGLEAGGRRRSLEKSLSLLRRARYVRTVSFVPTSSPLSCGPIPPAPGPCPERVDHPGSHLEDQDHSAGYGEEPLRDEGELPRCSGKNGGDIRQDRAEKRLKLWSDAPTEDIVSGMAGGTDLGTGTEVGSNAENHGSRQYGEGQRQEVEAQDDTTSVVDARQASDDDVLPWQVRFVMGRLCARLGRHPKMVLDNLSQALRLAKAEHVPLEDELECLCRLHTARAALILAGDTESFKGVAPLVEAYSFCEEESSAGTRDSLSHSQASQTSQAQPSQAQPSQVQPSQVKLSQAKPVKAQERGNESLAASLPFWGSFGAHSTNALGTTNMVPGRATGPQASTGNLQSTTNLSGAMMATSSFEPATSIPPRPRDQPMSHESDVGEVPERGGEKEGEVSVECRRLAALENCLLAFESCLKKRKWQHTAIFAIAIVLLKGEPIADAARVSGETDTATDKAKERSFGAEAARSVISRLFEKRPQQLWLAISMTDGMVGPGLALLGSRRRKLHALRRKYMGLYVDLLEVAKSSTSLQDLLRRTKATREAREEVLWVQARILRAMLGILRSEIRCLPEPETTQRQGAGAGNAASSVAASTSSIESIAPSSRNAESNPPLATASAGDGVSTGSVDGFKSVGVATEVNQRGTPGSNSTVSLGSAVGNSSGEAVQATSMAAATHAPSQMEQGRPQPSEEGRPQSARVVADEIEAPSGVSPQADGASSKVSPAPSAAGTFLEGVGTPASSGASSGHETEKRILERAWDLYLKVLDLDGTAPNHFSGVRGGPAILMNGSDKLNPGQVVRGITSTLLGDAEEVLVAAWKAFGAANPSLLELVEIQNPPLQSDGSASSSGRVCLGGGNAIGTGKQAGGNGLDVRRARACCNMLWPDRLGKGKVAKSKLRLKRPAPTQSQLASNRAAPRPRARSPVPPDKPASGGGTAAATSGTTPAVASTPSGGSPGASPSPTRTVAGAATATLSGLPVSRAMATSVTPAASTATKPTTEPSPGTTGYGASRSSMEMESDGGNGHLTLATTTTMEVENHETTPDTTLPVPVTSNAVEVGISTPTVTGAPVTASDTPATSHPIMSTTNSVAPETWESHAIDVED